LGAGEIVANLRKNTVYYRCLAHRGIVELRTAHGQEEVYQIEEEKGADNDKSRLLKILVSIDEIIKQRYYENEIIREISQIHQFAHHFRGEQMTPQQGRLATEKRLLKTGEEVVAVGKHTDELINVGIPDAQRRYLKQHACEHGEAAGG